MAVTWSWAFGSETLAVLTGKMEYVSPTGGGTQQPTSAAGDTYTYASFPGTKYSWSTTYGRSLNTPGGAFQANGTVAMALKSNTDWYASANAPLIHIETGSGKEIVMRPSVGGGVATVSCYIHGTLAGTFTLAANDWHYLAINYNVSGATWNASFWADGVQKATGTGISASAETTGYYRTGGYSDNSVALCGQIVVYDSATAAATAAAPIFVSRVAPNADAAGTGTWTPSTGATDFGVTAGDPLDVTEYTQEATPSSADNVVTEVNNLAAQLGASAAAAAISATNHTYSSGTGVVVNASTGVSGSYVTGGNVTPNAADTTYAFGTKSTGMTGTPTIQCKYTVV